MVSGHDGRFFNERRNTSWYCVLYYNFLHFQLPFIIEMEEESWILSPSMPKNIEAPKIDRNTKILVLA